MLGKKKKVTTLPRSETPKERLTSAFLRPDYPYQAIGEPITDLSTLEPGVVYEVKCHKCETRKAILQMGWKFAKIKTWEENSVIANLYSP